MDSVGSPPEIVRRQRHNADDAPDPVIGEAVPEERAVTAIVLDHEETDHEAGGRNGQQQIKPIAEPECEPHRQPQQNKRHDRDQNFEDAASVMRLAVAREILCQGTHVDAG